MLVHQEILFSHEECELIINSNKSTIDKNHSYNRYYVSSNITINDENNWIFERLKNFFEKTTPHKIKKQKTQIHFHEFDKGSWFGIHNDIRNERIFALGVLLNADFMGGDFIFYDNKSIEIEKKIGNTYVFDVRINHEVREVKDGKRKTLLLFLNNDDSVMVNQNLI